MSARCRFATESKTSLKAEDAPSAAAVSERSRPSVDLSSARTGETGCPFVGGPSSPPSLELISTPLSATLERGGSVACDAGLDPTASGCDGAAAAPAPAAVVGGEVCSAPPMTLLIPSASRAFSSRAFSTSCVTSAANRPPSGSSVSVRATLGCGPVCRFDDGW